jgi:hypothetical protein
MKTESAEIPTSARLTLGVYVIRLATLADKTDMGRVCVVSGKGLAGSDRCLF